MGQPPRINRRKPLVYHPTAIQPPKSSDPDTDIQLFFICEIAWLTYSDLQNRMACHSASYNCCGDIVIRIVAGNAFHTRVMFSTALTEGNSN